MEIDIQDYRYELPPERIASHPLADRDQSKLLVYAQGHIGHRRFENLPELLPPHSVIFFNDTRVIPARIVFQKKTGAEIEVFLLQPVSPSPIVSLAMEARRSSTWKCAIGNLKRWTDNLLLINKSGTTELTAKMLHPDCESSSAGSRGEGLVEFTWSPHHLTFAEIIQRIGRTPLPPYIRREPNEEDWRRYQTVYAHHDGAVAAPTAGLHFTAKTIHAIAEKGIVTDYLTLHISAGTFQPVKVSNALQHIMHGEQVVIRKKNIENLLSGRSVTAVGTTSLRLLESLYWYGNLLAEDPARPFMIDQHYPYHCRKQLTMEDSLQRVLNKMKNAETLDGTTSIYILPGYTFKVCDSLITNFHQPGSTLMLLVAAFAGPDWKRIYREALDHEYRFLSYGDTSLLFPLSVR